jgi:hypothetical protein
VFFVSTGKPKVLLNKKGETNLHHLRHFLLFTSQNAIWVQTCFMSNKHLRISSFAENHVSRPYFAQIVCKLTNWTQKLGLDILCTLWAQITISVIKCVIASSNNSDSDSDSDSDSENNSEKLTNTRPKNNNKTTNYCISQHQYTLINTRPL